MKLSPEAEEKLAENRLKKLKNDADNSVAYTIQQLLENGASIRQMEKLTGIGRGVIQNL